MDGVVPIGYLWRPINMKPKAKASMTATTIASATPKAFSGRFILANPSRPSWHGWQRRPARVPESEPSMFGAIPRRHPQGEPGGSEAPKKMARRRGS